MSLPLEVVGTKSRGISLPLVRPSVEENRYSNNSNLQNEISWLTLNKRYTEAIPLALESFLNRTFFNQSEVIEAAGVCLLGNRHDIYLALVELLPKNSHESIALSETQRNKILELLN